MSCENCGSGSDGKGGCGSGGCGSSGSSYGKLRVFDWLSNMRLPNGQEAFDCVEVRFKNDRKEFFKNSNNLVLYVGDTIAVEGKSGHDVGVVTMTGELVRIQMKKKRVREDSEDVRTVYRKANEKDIETWHENRAKEQDTMVRARKIARDLGLEMKISDVEYQADGTKATFYYTAEGRVDFRELIKKYAAAFGIRIEMKQIGFRQEAAKIGGIGSSGRELCCSTWLTDFRSVSTSAARYQQLSINPQKLAGQCGKLKCCLNFELDAYLDALEDFPSLDSTFETEKGKATCMKIDVFKREMWYTYQNDSAVWHKLTVDQVNEFITISKSGGKVGPLEELKIAEDEEPKDFTDVIEENSLERFERKNKRRRIKKKTGPEAKKEGDSKQGRSQKPGKRSRPQGKQQQQPKQQQAKQQQPRQKENKQQQPKQQENKQQKEKSGQKAPSVKKDRPAGKEKQPRNPDSTQNRRKGSNRNKNRQPRNKDNQQGKSEEN